MVTGSFLIRVRGRHRSVSAGWNLLPIGVLTRLGLTAPLIQLRMILVIIPVPRVATYGRRRARRFRTPLVFVLVGTLLALSGCLSNASSARLQIVVSFYPFEFLAQRVAGSHADVQSLTLPGAEPHGLELTTAQVAAVAQADLVIYQTGFQNTVDKAVTETRPRHWIDTATFLPLYAASATGTTDDVPASIGDPRVDPHTWLDPLNMVAITEHLRDALVTIDAAHASDYRAQAASLITDLRNLDSSFTNGLQTCQRQEFITSHSAFAYLARRYDLVQIGISGLDPNVEPTAARIREIHDLARQNHVTTIFFETLASDAVAKSVAGDLGLRTDVLDPVAGLTSASRGANYLEIMQANLAALRTANECA